MQTWRERAIRWLPLLVWMAAIFFVSGQPSNELPTFGVWDWIVKKSGHFLAYGLLALLAWRATAESPLSFLWALVITVAYAASDEFHQTLVLGRHGHAGDVLIDSLGGLTTLSIWFCWQRYFHSPPRQQQRSQ